MNNRLVDILRRSKEMAESVKSFDILKSGAQQVEPEVDEVEDEIEEEMPEELSYNEEPEDIDPIDEMVFYRGTTGKVDRFQNELLKMYRSNTITNNSNNGI